MEPSLASATATGDPARYHGAWSFNVERGIADGVNARSWADAVASALRASGCSLTAPDGSALAPAGHANPETTRQSVGLGTDRYVWTVEAWFVCNRTIQGRDLNLQVATAFKNSGAGRDFPAEDAARAMGACETVRDVQVRARTTSQTLAEGIVPVLFGYRTLFASVGTVCATYESYSGAARSNVSLNSPIARAAAGPIDQTNNPARLGESPVVWSWGSFSLTGTQVQVIAIVGGVVLVLGTAGYFLRSLKVVSA